MYLKAENVPGTNFFHITRIKPRVKTQYDRPTFTHVFRIPTICIRIVLTPK